MSSAKLNAKNILDRLKTARTQVETLLKDRSWMDEAKKIAEKQGQEVKKLIDTDVAKLRIFLEKERQELEKLQAQIPGEVKKVKKFVDGQKKELSKLLTVIQTKAKQKSAKVKSKVSVAKTAAKKAPKKTVTKKASKKSSAAK